MSKTDGKRATVIVEWLGSSTSIDASSWEYLKDEKLLQVFGTDGVIYSYSAYNFRTFKVQPEAGW